MVEKLSVSNDQKFYKKQLIINIYNFIFKNLHDYELYVRSHLELMEAYLACLDKKKEKKS